VTFLIRRSTSRVLGAVLALASSLAVAESTALSSGASSETLIVPVIDTVAQSNLQVGDNFRDCEECPAMVVVPAGEFMMGSPPSEPGRESNEVPQHKVTISKPFAAGMYEVTWDDWEYCVKDGGCDGSGPENSGGDQGWGKGKRPVGEISFQDTQDYPRWLTGKTGKQYRLLSEAEWEYVARAGTTTPFNTGEQITSSQANFEGNYTYNGSEKGIFRNKSTPAGSFPPNAFGLYDVHGNLWEWVQDCWHESYVGAPPDGSAWETDDCPERTVRSGSFDNGPVNMRSAARGENIITDRTDGVGFRIGRTLD